MAEFTPTFAPFTFHWKPPTPEGGVADAVNKTTVLAQTAALFVVIATEGVTTGFTVINTFVEVAVFGLAQVLPEVTTHQIESPVAKAEVLKVAEFVPALVPLRFH